MPWLLAWSCAAIALAVSRIPYDDEWFSIELALRANDEQFWDALAHDVHPPWVALLDRGIAQLWASPVALQLAHLTFAVAAIAVLARALATRLELPRWAFALAALHPVVIFYAGAARWYPVLFLAHSLRLAAVLRAGTLRPVDGASFFAGGVLGSMASYVDPLFLAHDAAWLVVRHARERREWLRVAFIAGATGLAVIALRFASPLQRGIHDPLHRAQPHWDAMAIAQWLGFGLAGEAALPWPLTLTGVACVIAVGWAFIAALRDPAAKATASWLGTYGLCWLVACGFGVWLPRYSLLVWVLSFLLVVRLAVRGSRSARAACALSAAHLAIGLVLAGTGRGFFKTDLNRLQASDCAALAAASDAPLLIVPYPRLAAQAQKECSLRAPIVSVPSIRVIRAESAQLAELRARLTGVSGAWLLTLSTESSLRRTDRRVRALLGRACRVEHTSAFGDFAHRELRRDTKGHKPRFMLERWRCG